MRRILSGSPEPRRVFPGFPLPDFAGIRRWNNELSLCCSMNYKTEIRGTSLEPSFHAKRRCRRPYLRASGSFWGIFRSYSQVIHKQGFPRSPCGVRLVSDEKRNKKKANNNPNFCNEKGLTGRVAAGEGLPFTPFRPTLARVPFGGESASWESLPRAPHRDRPGHWPSASRGL